MSAKTEANACSPGDERVKTKKDGSPGTSKEGRPAKASSKDLDTFNANRGVWLVKVPKYIADRWEAAPDSTDVGKLKITRRPAQKPQVSFTLSDAIVSGRTSASSGSGATAISPDKSAIPKEHRFEVSTLGNQTMGVFSDIPADPDAVVPVDERLSLEGKVVQRAECLPIRNDAVYRAMKEKTFKRAFEPQRKVQQLDRVVSNYKPIANHAANIQHERTKKLEGKKSRDDKDKVMSDLFALFEKHQYYNIKDLVKETRQPVTYLKEILKDVCNYNLKNPYKNTWELKPEYRHYKAEVAPKEDEAVSSDDD